MADWEVTILASKKEKSLALTKWVERVSALDIVSARGEALVKARQKKPHYLLYETSTIFEVKT
jgi:hypothetical protein